MKFQSNTNKTWMATHRLSSTQMMNRRTHSSKLSQLKIPASIVNTGQALNYVLYSSGFALKDLRQTDVETLKLYSLKVPLVNRSFFRVTVEQIIAETLIGDAYVMNVD